jgi:hypothetical protein
MFWAWEFSFYFGHVIQAETYQFDCCELLVIRLGSAHGQKVESSGCYSKKNRRGFKTQINPQEWLGPPSENLQWGFRYRCSRGIRATESDALIESHL